MAAQDGEDEGQRARMELLELDTCSKPVWTSPQYGGFMISKIRYSTQGAAQFLLGSLLFLLVLVPFLRHTSKELPPPQSDTSPYTSKDRPYKCPYIKAGSTAEESVPQCLSTVEGLSQVYDLNPKQGNAFEGSEVLGHCLTHCTRRRHLADGSFLRRTRQVQEASNAEGAANSSASALNGPTHEIKSPALDSIPTRGASRRLLQQQVARDKTRISLRANAIAEEQKKLQVESLTHSGLRMSAGGDALGAPISGNVHPDGLYYIAVGLGNPPRTFYLDIDTGSRLSWVTCDAPCVQCARGPNGYYNPANAALVPCTSATCQAGQQGGSFQGCQEGGGDGDQCDYDIAYGDGSSSQGVLLTDTLVFLHEGVLKSTPLVFGCAYDQEGHLAQSPAKSDGMLGLGIGPLSLPAQLSRGGAMKSVFGHCLSNRTSGGGFFFLGDSLVPPDTTWVQFIAVPGLPYYFVPLESIRVQGHTAVPLDLSPLTASPRGAEGAVMDSGSSFTFLPTTVFDPVFGALDEEAQRSGLALDPSDHTLPHCWRGPPGDEMPSMNAFPRVELGFSGPTLGGTKPTLTLEPYGYLIRSERGSLCLGLLRSSSPLIVIGDVSLRGLLMVYDNEEARLGWAPSSCQRKR